jgi:hypothetical protein
MGVCVSRSDKRVDCITPTSKGRVDCSFGNKQVRCPSKSYVLPASSGPLNLEADNVTYEPID